jgi:putative ABC transport system permease protein
VAESLESSFLALYRRQGADLVVQRRGGAVQLSKGIPLAFGDRIRALSESGEVISGLMDLVAFEDHDLFMVIANGWEPNCPVFDRIRVLEGRRLRPGDQRSVMLGRVLAANLGKRTGDTVEVYAQPFQVVGVFESVSIYENGAVFLLLDELQQQMDRPGQVTGFIVQAQPAGDAATIERLRQKIEAIDPEIAATPCAAFVHSLSQMRVARTMSWVTSAIASLIGAIGVLNTMAMSAYERRGEIGALRAMGWPKQRVIGLILSESLLLAMVGTVAGCLGGIAIIQFLAHWPATAVLVQGDVSWKAITEGGLLAVLMAVCGALYPAWRCASLPPVDALRGS